MGFWKKVAGAFVEFDETLPPPGQGADAEALGAEAERLLAELNAVPSSAPPIDSRRPAAKAPPPGSRVAESSPPARAAASAGSKGRPAASSQGGATKSQGSAGDSASPPPLPDSGAQGRPFAEIYAEAGVANAPYSAEQLLAVLDRLRAMPREQILIAVDAMDAADDRWNVADVLHDAERKQQALQSNIDRLDATERKSEEEVAAKSKTLAEQVAQAEAEVKAQIETLQAQIAELRSEAEAERVRLQSRIAEHRQGFEAERNRLSEEMKRLRFVSQFFQRTAPTP